MLEMWLIPQLRDRGLLDDVWLQRDGAAAHLSLSVRDVLNEHFQAAGLAVAHRHLRHHCHGHHIVLTLPHQTMLWGIIKGGVAARR